MSTFASLIPHQASSLAPQVDSITLGFLIFSGALTLLVFGLIVIFGVAYREGSTRSRKIVNEHELLLECGWTGATLILFVGFFVWGSVPFMHMRVPPSDATEVTVVAKQWMWKFQHPNGMREINDLHIPVGVPVLLTMTSEDVIHSFFVPDFRVKQDVLPGRYTHLWFKPTEVGVYHLFCTQYCGTMHADMQGKIIVMDQADFQNWQTNGLGDQTLAGGASGSLQGAERLSMASRGRDLFTRLGCISCHGGFDNVQPGVKAPVLQGIFGKPVGLDDGTSVIADENYIRESILYPGAKIVKGYQNIMPAFQGVVSEENVLDLIAFIKALNGTPQTQAPEGAAASPPPVRVPGPTPIPTAPRGAGRKAGAP